jgi:hypothetical protein
MSDVKNYNANQIDLIIAGLPISDGYADGEFVNINQNGDDYALLVGADGSPVRSALNDRSAIVEVTLMQTSNGNSLFAALRSAGEIQRLTGGAGVDIAPFLIRDKLGTALYTAKESWIAKPPQVMYDKVATPRKWTIAIANLIRFDGGS